MDDKEWLAGLKAGDEVVVSSGYVQRVPAIHRVTRVTGTLVIVGASRYRKSDGYAPGNGYHRGRIVQPTPERRDIAEEKMLRARLESIATSPETALGWLNVFSVMGVARVV